VIFDKHSELKSLLPKLWRLYGLVAGITLLSVAYALVERSDKSIVERQSKRAFVAVPLLQLSDEITDDERRVANLFIADTLPRLMKKGLITKYVRNETNTTLLVVGSVWKGRTRFVKESLLTAVLAFNKVNGHNLWTRVLDECDGTLYAQVLPSDRRELYE
jgi:hypothetical protein